jgi:signal transduction histidine kinase/putative methionine-R-sulfoxide reductase with GAF domain
MNGFEMTPHVLLSAVVVLFAFLAGVGSALAYLMVRLRRRETATDYSTQSLPKAAPGARRPDPNDTKEMRAEPRSGAPHPKENLKSSAPKQKPKMVATPSPEEANRQAEFEQTIAKLEKLNKDLSHKNEELQNQQAKLAEDLKKRDLLIGLTQSLTQTLELKSLLGTMLKKIREILVFQSGGVFLYNQDKTELWVAATEGFYEQEMASQLGADVGVPAIVAQTSKSLMFNDINEDPRFATISKSTRVHSAIYYPISSGKTAYGVVCLWNMEPNAYSPTDLEILHAVTSEAARAIKNAEIYQELDSRLNFIVTLWETSKNLTSAVDIASPAWDTVLDDVLTSILTLFHSEKAAFMRYSTAKKELVPAIARGFSEPGLGRLGRAVNNSPLGLPFFLHNTFQVKDFQRDPRFNTFAEVSLTEDLQAALWAPLMGRQMTIGALGLFSVEPRSWSQMELQWVDIFANMFSMTLENIFLFQDLASEKSQLQVLVDNMPEGVFTTDISGRVQTWNAAAQRITGWTLQEMAGRPCSEFIKCQTIDEVWCATKCPLRVAMDTQAKYDSGMEKVFVLMRPPVQVGEGVRDRVPVFITSAPIYSDEGKIAGSILVFRDITKEKEIEQMKEDFLATITHDLKSPLASVMGYAELMLNPKMGGINPNHREFLEAIMRSSKTLQFLIDNILEITRMEAGKMLFHPNPFDMGSLLEEIREMFRPLAAPKSLDLQMVCEPHTMVYGDRDKIKEVFINFYSNAIKFTPQKGVVKTTVTVEGSKATIKVSDTGKGIPADQISRLFQKFAQVKSDERRGTGLGLYIVRRILQAHGEEVDVESQEGKGTTFIFALPLADSVTNGKSASGSVLILEKDRMTSEVVKRVLEDQGGLHIVQAMSANDALNLISEQQPRVLVVDSKIDVQSGANLLGQLRNAAEGVGQHVRILLICEAEDATEKPPEADSRIFRPLDYSELLIQVQSLLGT